RDAYQPIAWRTPGSYARTQSISSNAVNHSAENFSTCGAILQSCVPVRTLEEDRPIAEEAEVVAWMIAHASVGGSLAHLEPKVKPLRVVGRCSCGSRVLTFNLTAKCHQPNRLLTPQDGRWTVPR